MSAQQISFDSTPAEDKIIFAITKRAFKEVFAANKKYRSLLDIAMDITACHCNGCPLKLDELLCSTPENFNHDIVGIFNHLDRTTGKLTDGFYPRYAQGE